MFRKGEVKVVTFYYDIIRKQWLTEQDHLLEDFLKGIHFVSACACGQARHMRGERLIVFYVEPKGNVKSKVDSSRQDALPVQDDLFTQQKRRATTVDKKKQD